MRKPKHAGYNTPDELAHVYSFASTWESAKEIAELANTHGVTRSGKFIAGSFTVMDIPGRMPAVVGKLSGK